MFVDTLPSPYYDMLVVNAFVEFGDLMYSVGRIEDGIKRGKIVDTKASMKEKRSKPDEHVQAMFRERKSKRKLHTTWEEPIENYPHSSSYAQVPRLVFLHPKSLYGNAIETLIQAILRAKKGKGPKCTMRFQ